MLGLLASNPLRAEHFDIKLLAVGPDGVTQEAFADQSPPEGGLNPRPVLKARAGDRITVQFIMTNVYPHGAAADAGVHYYIVKESQLGQKNVPGLGQGVVIEGTFTFALKPQARVGTRQHFTIRQPGNYLLRVESQRTQRDHEHFSAYRSGLKALSLNEQDPKVWEMFERVALGSEQFDTVIERIDSAFPQQKPVWATDIRNRAQTLLQQWTKEQELRSAQDAAANLPRVLLTIEHVIFERLPDGSTSARPKTTGRDEVEVELFEDQAPITVANFLSLVESGFYNGTRFHWAQSASMVVGGDPNSKNDNPEDDGAGGPGYVIPDEFDLSRARSHFRGTLAMVETGPHTAGSQFLIALVPHPAFDHHLTAFGRVIRGQEGADRITAGRTNFRVGQFGKAIPGDRLVRAQVIRKRPHPYRVVKEKP